LTKKQALSAQQWREKRLPGDIASAGIQASSPAYLESYNELAQQIVDMGGDGVIDIDMDVHEMSTNERLTAIAQINEFNRRLERFVRNGKSGDKNFDKLLKPLVKSGKKDWLRQQQQEVGQTVKRWVHYHYTNQ
jgi:hypothetical protein